jgi:hypothetical protein
MSCGNGFYYRGLFSLKAACPFAYISSSKSTIDLPASPFISGSRSLRTASAKSSINGWRVLAAAGCEPPSKPFSGGMTKRRLRRIRVALKKNQFCFAPHNLIFRYLLKND